MRKVQLFRNADAPEWLKFDSLYNTWVRHKGSFKECPNRPTGPRYIVEPCGEGLFHGFFQKTELMTDGHPEHYPIALVERADGTVEEFLPEHVRFEKGQP